MELDVKAIRLAMARKQLTIAGLARAAGITQPTLNLYINHGTRPRIDKLGMLATALGVDVTEIIKED